MLRIKFNESYLYNHTDGYDRTWSYEKFLTTEGIIKESNWSRLKKHINENCFMISACRSENTEQENKIRTEKLMSDLKTEKLGYIRVLGGYIENKGEPDESEVVEESFFVPMPKWFTQEEFFNVAIKLCKKYNQDSVLISMPGYTDFGYYNKNGNFDFSPGNKLTFDDSTIGQYFSTLMKGSRRNTKWAFTTEWLAIRHPSSVSQAVWMEQHGEMF